MIMLKNVGLGDFYIILQILWLQLGKDLINMEAKRIHTSPLICFWLCHGVPLQSLLATLRNSTKHVTRMMKGYIHLADHWQALHYSSYIDVKTSLYYERGTPVLKEGVKIVKMALLFSEEIITFSCLSSSLLWKTSLCLFAYAYIFPSCD